MSDVSARRASQRQNLTAAALIGVVRTLVGDFDVIDVLTQLSARCVDLLDVDAAGILLANSGGHLCVVGASSEEVELLELFQVQNVQGPCLDCYTTGQAIAAPDLTAASAWPQFAAKSVAAGYPSVYAIPLRHNSETLGCLNLFTSTVGALASTGVTLAHALADVASIAIVQSHSNHQAHHRDDRLHHPLTSRIIIEQAKGMIAERTGFDMHEAFELLRSHAHDHHRSLTGTAEQLVAGTIPVSALERTPHPTPEMCELTMATSTDDGRRVLRIGGELDLDTRIACFNAFVNGDSNVVAVDIAAITFMDCAGYGALVAARLVLEERGGSLTVRNPTGQPAYLLKLIARDGTVDGDESSMLLSDASPE